MGRGCDHQANDLQDMVNYASTHGMLWLNDANGLSQSEGRSSQPMRAMILCIVLWCSSGAAWADNCAKFSRLLNSFSSINSMQSGLAGRADLMSLDSAKHVGNGIELTHVRLLTRKIDGFRRECLFGIAQRDGKIFQISFDGEFFDARKSVCTMRQGRRCVQRVVREFRVVGSDARLLRSVLAVLEDFAASDSNGSSPETRAAIAAIRREGVPRHLAIDAEPFEAVFASGAGMRLLVQMSRDDHGIIKVTKITEEQDAV